MIRLEHLNKYYNKGKANELHVVNDISLELPETGIVALFGRSGCGKTTLLNLIGGLDSFASGTLEINGQSIRKHTDELRNREIGYIFQNYNLNKSESIFDNVADALRLCGMKDGPELERRVQVALENVGMYKYRKRTPDTLSGGQQQRVAIARAIVKNPPVILADEPTGNLDDANTIQVMELLKELGRDRLIVLVTHEAKLVDYYCDLVIELQDGTVRGIRENTEPERYSSEDHSTIYLGELEKQDISTEYTDIAFYGEKPQEPIRLRLVGKDGKYYLQVDTPGVQLLSESSEVRLREGCHSAEQQQKERQDRIHLEELPPFEGRAYGRLFDLKQSIKSGFASCFPGRMKKQTKLLRTAMTLFAAILVLTTALCGVAIKNLKEIDRSGNGNVFYLRLKDTAAADRIAEGLNAPDSGIDFLTTYVGYISRDRNISFELGSFESFSAGLLTDYSTNGVLLDTSLLKGQKTAAGDLTRLKKNDLVITTTSADILMEKISVGYVRNYRDLLGFTTTSLSYQGQPLRIAAVVESDETAFYLSPEALAETMLVGNDLNVVPAEYVKRSVEPGTVILVKQYENEDVVLPLPGEKITIHGMDFTVSEWIEPDNSDPAYDAFYVVQSSYWDEEWLEPICYSDQYYLMNEADLVRISGRFGVTDRSATNNPDYYMNRWNMVIHSADPEKTNTWLKAAFPESLNMNRGLVTPADTRAALKERYQSSITRHFTTMATMLVLMCLCLYFMMRSNLMSRIREVGIYRAIGVSKSNLIFRFGVEALILSCFTIFVGFIGTSLIMLLWLKGSTLMSSIFYYPLWLAGSMFVLLVLLTVLQGILPILLLLRKTPSQILAKFDI